jgi:structural maintenance of chromosome 1
MDAISFVLGVKSAQLRSSQLKDLVYRGRRLGTHGVDGESDAGEENEAEEEEEAEDGEGTAKKAWVLAVYEDENKKKWNFQRTCVYFSLVFKIYINTTYLTGSPQPVHLNTNLTTKL